jgi:hypothetical protein
MIAVYSDLVFGDTSLYAAAEAEQRRYGLTLLTALDLPWQADGLQRDGPHVREPVDRQLRAALARAGIAFEPVSGSGSGAARGGARHHRASARAPGPETSGRGAEPHEHDDEDAEHEVDRHLPADRPERRAGIGPGLGPPSPARPGRRAEAAHAETPPA